MKWKRTCLLTSAALLFGASVMRAQEPTAEIAPPPPDAFMHGGPVGPHMEILGFGEMHPGKVVTGAPYSAVAVTETKQTLADGNVIDRKVQSNVYRDSQGRTRRETTFTGVGPLSASGCLSESPPGASMGQESARIPAPAVGPFSPFEASTCGHRRVLLLLFHGVGYLHFQRSAGPGAGPRTPEQAQARLCRR